MELLNGISAIIMEAASRCPFPHCNKLFSNCYNLKKHINSHHLKIKPFKCAYCEKTFGYKHSMLHHQFTHEQAEKEQYVGAVEGLDLCQMLLGSKDPDLCPFAKKRVKRFKRKRSQTGRFELLPEIRAISQHEKTTKLPVPESLSGPF